MGFWNIEIFIDEKMNKKPYKFIKIIFANFTVLAFDCSKKFNGKVN